ncbi:MAG: succinate dehydrogenase, cytochrome b556 subunit [Ardenticatenaceae bacterium]|nr:succinate dehydrogenase, cytochrome b556 subunit [Anaerolineales bacterium]MCB8921264.1 succinate dehydrogenase, cytochrome b556 subunit [Ardenticatenaceae bacterium]MCB8990630.1 succinate dehydrogenase, cytochrome b556 subunit [Ardenticatenaceae bacterium]MCB9004337.1 succinate dehydrogenase, cytochrome b556 subunit [Ardenticatenaceae bacterium]
MYKTTGFFSFVLRRVTGVALALYLFLHMWVIGSVNQGAEAFDARLATVQSPLFKFLEIALLAAVIYHAIDGIRLLIVHYFDVAEYRKSLFYAVMVVSVLLGIAGGLPMLLFAINGG